MSTRETPVDELTGLPLLFVPHDDIPSIMANPKLAQDTYGHQVADWNHVWHPGKVVTHAGKGGVALRSSRVQYVMRTEHDRYHAQFDGPPLPQRPTGRFVATVLSAAGYIPPAALSFNERNVRIVRLSHDERRRLHCSGEVRVAQSKHVRTFMRDFVIGQPLSHIRNDTIDRFLDIDPQDSADSAKEHRYLAHLLLSLAIDQVEETVAHPYRWAHESGLLAPDAPKRVDEFILDSIVGSQYGIKHVSQVMTRRLTSHREQESPLLILDSQPQMA